MPRGYTFVGFVGILPQREQLRDVRGSTGLYPLDSMHTDTLCLNYHI